MTSYTPGPWTLAYDGNPNQNPYWHAVELRSGPLLVARVDCTNASGQGPHNARLLEAAAEVVDALQALYDWCHGNVPYFGEDADDAEQCAVVMTVEAALDKATGKATVRASTPEECAKDGERLYEDGPIPRLAEIAWWGAKGWTWEYPGFLQAPGTPGYNFTVGLDDEDARYVVQITTEDGANVYLADVFGQPDVTGEFRERGQVLAALEDFKTAKYGRA